MRTVRRGVPVLHRYYALRRRLMGLADLRGYDLAVPLATIARTFTLPDARALTLEAVRPLGQAYVDRLDAATSARWMDAFPRPGKFGGSYCNPGAYDVHPYVLLNFTPSYAGVTAFAHEWGHAMHGAIAREAQPFDTFNAPAFVQEVASTCHEQLLIQHMISTARTSRERLFYLGQQLETIALVFYRQGLRAEFEADLHRRVEAGEAPSGERLTAMYFKLMEDYYGETVLAPFYPVEWARQVQYYDEFYVFQYITSITGGVHFSRACLEGGVQQQDTYLAILRAGGSDYGYTLLRAAGLDLADVAPYRAVVDEFSRTLDKAEKLAAELAPPSPS